MKMEDGWCYAEALYLDTFVTHEDVPLALDDMLKILVSCNVVWADKKIHEVEWLELWVAWGVFR